MTDIYGNVGMGTTMPDISALLDLTTTQAGLLIPRLAQTQRDAIYHPATTLLIYNKTANQFEYNAGTPTTPNWVPFLSSLSVIGFNQIGAGTNSGQTLNVGNGSVLQPTGTGLVIANQLSGAGNGKFAGSIPIPLNTTDLSISFPGLNAGAVVVVSITDPVAPGIVSTTTTKNPGSGFDVHFSSPYPNVGASLDYIVINP
ncbi:MAG: hypothetical protein IT211_04075 [Armatimonadetes bacterium]|nr:hypothetical protein [Armatimonadota bacterium]